MHQGLSRDALLAAALAALCVYVFALVSPAIFNDGDTFWHIRAGTWMIAHHRVLDHDIFSLPFPGRPWDTQEWLSEVLLAGSFQLFGWSGVAILTGLAIAATVALLALYLARRLDPIPAIAVLTLAIGCVMPDLLARPHILALPFLTVWIVGLAEAAEAARAPHWFLLAAMTLWTNLHGSFVFGLVLLVPFAVDAILAATERRGGLAIQWCLFAATSVLATLMNPRGLNGLLYPFALMKLHSLAAIGEWQALDLHSFNPVELAIGAALFFLVWRGVRISAVRLLLLLALVQLTLLHTRYGMILGIAGAILLAGPIGAAVKREPRPEISAGTLRFAAAGLAALLVACTTLRIAFPIRRGQAPTAPAIALAAVPASLAGRPLFNNYTFGGYLIWKGVRPLVDSRADFYGDAWLADYWRAVSGDPATVDRLFRKYQVAWTLLKPTDPLVAELDHRPGWHRLYADHYAVVQAGPDVSRPASLAVSAQE